MNTLMKKSFIAVSVALALGACQQLEPTKQKSAERDQIQAAENERRIKVAQEAKKESRQALEESEVVRVTGGRVVSAQADMSYGPVMKQVVAPMPQVNNEQYQHFEESRLTLTAENSVSTFSVDVDTGSYSNVRRMLNDGYLPPHDAVRLEEFVNYFDYDYPQPETTETPFSVSMETMKTPWNQSSHLVQIGIKGYDPTLEANAEPLPPANLVFLIDVSGSMGSADKLGLVKKAMKMLVQKSTNKDRISLVVYAGASGVVLEPTAGNDQMKIEQALERLNSGGSTNGGAGIELAYAMAEKAYIKGGINRVILATDGDFNVGTVNREALIDLVERKRETGVSFSALGFGRGNYNEHLMEQLANKGNGNYAYIDSLQEARKVLIEQRAGTLMTIAKDVKIQVEFNPNVISEYRLLGYENRALNREDFNNDKVDAGEIGAGHTVTALYEVVMTGNGTANVDPLRYGKQANADRNPKRLRSTLDAEAAMVKLRYKLPEEDTSRLIHQAVYKKNIEDGMGGHNVNYAASVAGFAQLLRGGRYLNQWTWDDAIKLAQVTKGGDLNGYRGEMVRMMKMAKHLSDANKSNASASGH